MRFAVCAVFLLGLTPVSSSAPPTCGELLRPAAQLDVAQLAGRWVLSAGSMSQLPYLERFRHTESATVTFSNTTGDSNIFYTLSIRRADECKYESFNISLQGSSFTFAGHDRANLSARFVHTSCDDCLLMLKYVNSGERQHLYLLSRRRQLQPTELEEFKGQVECLNMPPPAVMDPSKELCPGGEPDETQS